MTARTRMRPGFTLVELLVVIAIIAILVSLTAAAVQKVRQRGQDVTCTADIQQLGTAITQFKARFGVYPPCFGSGPEGTFVLRTNYDVMAANSPERVMLQQMFPRMFLNDNGLRVNARPFLPQERDQYGLTGATNPPVFLDPNQALIVFLSGGTYTDYQGFSTNPRQPFAVTAGNSSSRLQGGAFWTGFEQAARRTTPEEYLKGGNRFSSDTAASKAQPWFIDPWGQPYLYFCTTQGGDYPFDPNFRHPDPGVQTTGRLPFRMAPWTIIGENPTVINTMGLTPFRESGTRFVESRGFQIISGGRNKFFGEGGIRSPGTGNYALNKLGGDDHANFQQTPLGVTD